MFGHGVELALSGLKQVAPGLRELLHALVLEDDEHVGQVDAAVAHPVALDQAPEQAIRALAPGGVDRIIEVAFSENADLDAAVAATGGVVAVYATRRDRPDITAAPRPSLSCPESRD